MVNQRIDKPRTKRGKRFLENRDSKVVENTKRAMFVKGGHTNEVVISALKQFCLLKKPFSQMLVRKNALRPFDDPTTLEYLSTKNDDSLFMFGCHSKKRPNNLIIGRMFDHNILDMFEFGIEKFVPMNKFPGPKITVGTKPCLVFHGEAFDADPDYMRMKCLFTDFFRGETVEKIRLHGFEHSMHFTAIEGKVYIRVFRIKLAKSENKIPNVELEEMGPALDLNLRRSKLGSDDLYKKSKKQPKEIVSKKVKNVSWNAFGSKLGRIHMEKQDLAKLQTRKLKALKRKKGEDEEANGDENAKKPRDEGDVEVENTEQVDE